MTSNIMGQGKGKGTKAFENQDKEFKLLLKGIREQKILRTHIIRFIFPCVSLLRAAIIILKFKLIHVDLVISAQFQNRSPYLISLHHLGKPSFSFLSLVSSFSARMKCVSQSDSNPEPMVLIM